MIPHLTADHVFIGSKVEGVMFVSFFFNIIHISYDVASFFIKVR